MASITPQSSVVEATFTHEWSIQPLSIPCLVVGSSEIRTQHKMKSPAWGIDMKLASQEVGQEVKGGLLAHG